MDLHVISAYQTSAQEFFEQLEQWHTLMVVDIRLHNTSQLSGFTKLHDLEYFCHRILNANYAHDVEFSPASTTLDAYLHHKITWEQYFAAYRQEMEERKAIPQFLERYGEYDSVTIIGTATDQRRSHAEVLQSMVEEALGSKAAPAGTAPTGTAPASK